MLGVPTVLIGPAHFAPAALSFIGDIGGAEYEMVLVELASPGAAHCECRA